MHEPRTPTSKNHDADDVVVTERLAERPFRPADHTAECAALTSLARSFANTPEHLWTAIAEATMTLCRADSGAIALLERSPNGPLFHWSTMVGAATVRENDAHALSDIVTARDAVVLFDRPARAHNFAASLDPLAFECLVAPFYARGVVVGAIWAIAHTPERRFDTEDARLLSSLASFASAAHPVLHSVASSTAKLHETERLELLRRLTTAQEDERRRVARDLHDQTAQLLAALALAVKRAEAYALPPSAREALADVRRLADALGHQVHDLATQLRPRALDDLGLEAALEQHVARWGDRVGIKTDFETLGLEKERLPTPIETTLYRVVQECLTNILKHAHASHVVVVVQRRSGEAIAIVRDDGSGFDLDALMNLPGHARLGLLGMRERVSLVGGRLDIESAAGRGTIVTARIPLTSPPGGPGG